MMAKLESCYKNNATVEYFKTTRETTLQTSVKNTMLYVLGKWAHNKMGNI